MNDLLNDPKVWFMGLLGGYVTLLSVIANGWVKRIERLESEAATKAEVNSKHIENVERLKRIEEGVTGTHRRIDDLYSDLLDKMK